MRTYLAEAVDLDYPTAYVMHDKWKPKSVYFMRFDTMGERFVVKLQNHWYSHGRLGPNAYVVSVHTIKKSGVLSQGITKMSRPHEFASGFASALERFRTDVGFDGLIVRVRTKDPRASKLIARVVGRHPRFKARFDFGSVQLGQRNLSFIMKKGKKVSKVFSKLRMEIPNLDNYSLDDIANALAPKIEAEDPTPSRTYRLTKKDIWGADPATEFAKNMRSTYGAEAKPTNPQPPVLLSDGLEQFYNENEIYKEVITSPFDIKNTLGNRRINSALENKRDIITTDFSPVDGELIEAMSSFTSSGHVSMRALYLDEHSANNSSAIKAAERLETLFTKHSHPMTKGIYLHRGVKASKYGSTRQKAVTFIVASYNKDYMMTETYSSFSMAPNIAADFGVSLSVQTAIKEGKGTLLPVDKINKELFSLMWRNPLDVCCVYSITGAENGSFIVPGIHSNFTHEAEVIVARGQYIRLTKKQLFRIDHVPNDTRPSFFFQIEGEFVRSGEVMIDESTKKRKIRKRSERSKDTRKGKKSALDLKKLTPEEIELLEEKYGSIF